MQNAHSNSELVKALASIAGIAALFLVVLHGVTKLIP